MQICAAMRHVNAQAIGDDSSDSSRLAQQARKRAFNGQSSNRNNRIARSLSRRRTLLTKHYVISYTSGKRKIDAMESSHLNLHGRSPLQPFGHGFSGKGPLRRHERKKYDS